MENPRICIKHPFAGRGKKGKLLRIGDGNNLVDITYIDNAAQAHIDAYRALESNPNCIGKAYFISQGTPVSLWSFINEIIELAGLTKITRSISSTQAYYLATLMEFIHSIFPFLGEPKLTRFSVHQLNYSHWFSIEAARKDLRYNPTISTTEGLTKIAEWARNYVKSA